MKLIFTLLAILSFGACADEVPPPPTVEQVPAPPSTAPAPTGVDVEEDLEPEVNIIKRDDAVMHEYRMNGQLYMVKVVPVVGPPYYLFDSNGDGNLDIRRNELDPQLVVPNWMIFRW